MILFVSLGCSWGRSLYQLSLDGRKLPAQVYSPVTRWAVDVGLAELARLLSAGPHRVSVREWPKLPVPLAHCLFNTSANFGPQQSQTLERQNCSSPGLEWLHLISFQINIHRLLNRACVLSKWTQTECSAVSVSNILNFSFLIVKAPHDLQMLWAESPDNSLLRQKKAKTNIQHSLLPPSATWVH